MNTPGVRPLLSPPPLPRITSRDHPAEPEGDSARPTNRRPVEPVERRAPTWRGDPSSTSRASTPVRESRTSGTRPAGAPVSERPPLPPARGNTAAAAVARVVDPAIASPPRQGNVIRIALGELVIELVLRDSRLYGKVLVETESAKDLIEGHLDDLRRGLERRGVEIGKFEVIVDEPDPAPPGEPPVRSVRRLVLDVLA